jgi:uncharacterized protein with FMN-binding domain
MAGNGSRNDSKHKVANSLVALSSAAVLAVYSAGYVRTKSADRLALLASERRPARPSAAEAIAPAPISLPPTAPAPTAAPAVPPAAAGPAPEAALAPTPPPAPDPGSAAAALTPATEAASQVTAVPGPSPAPKPAAVQPSKPAPAAAPAAPPPTAEPAAPALKDGTFKAWGTSRHGDIEAVVIIEGGKITYADFATCETKYPCNIIDKLPGQVVTRQSPEVDFVSGATESADAFYFAVVRALKQAK